MAQVGRSVFEETYGDGGVRGRVRAALRIDEVPRPVLVACAVLAAVALALGAVLAWGKGAPTLLERTDPESGAGTAAEAAGETVVGDQGAAASAESQVAEGVPAEGHEATLFVHVAGAVAFPGVYELPVGARVVDAVEAAGGFDAQADEDAVNLAQTVSDGTQVRIPFIGERETTASAVGAGGAAPAADAGGTVNVNTASAEQLQGLPGVGEVLAQAIVRDREANGPFTSPEDLMRVSGIGEKKFEGMRDRVAI